MTKMNDPLMPRLTIPREFRRGFALKLWLRGETRRIERNMKLAAFTAGFVLGVLVQVACFANEGGGL